MTDEKILTRHVEFVGKILVLYLFVMMFLPESSTAFFERRKEQFLTEPSYLILPLPYSIPGIGSGFMFMGLAGNFLETHMDIYGMGITGDAGGSIIGLDDIHLIPETLIVKLFYQDLNKVAVKNYEKRGMATEKDEYTQIELNKVIALEGEILLSLFDRRVELFFGQNRQDIAITTLRDSDGELIKEFSDPYEQESESTIQGIQLDFTDDYQDPRLGVRLGITRQPRPPSDSTIDPDYVVWNKSISVYIPIGENHTWAFNYFASDAIVSREGETDPAVIRANLGLSCQSTDQQCLDAQQDLVDMFIASRTNGNASSLGGQYRLRAYPQNRFQGAHTLYYATEFRWNFVTDVTPFDFWIWKDVSTGIQLAAFHEVGAVEDDISDLNNSLRSSSGIGIRMVSGSGYVYRFDVATGDEGAATTLFFNYPW